MYIWVSIATGTTLYRAIRAAAGVSLGEEMTFGEIMRSVVDIGITPVLLVVFIIYFIWKSKNDDARVNKANEMLLQREQQLLEDGNRREEMIRRESEKRESILMGNMERMIQNMDRITETMHNIDLSMVKTNERMEKIEEIIKERVCVRNGGGSVEN